MLSDYVSEQSRLKQGSFRDDLDGFTDWLTSQRYSRQTIRSYVYAAARFTAWAQANDCAGSSMLGDASLMVYREHLSAQRKGRATRDTGNTYCGARRFVLFLRQRNGTASNIAQDVAPLEALLCNWLRQHRGLSTVTVDSYARIVRRLLKALGNDPRKYTAAQLRAFVLTESRGYSHSKTNNTVTAVRVFVRFLIAHQECPDNLQYAIPRVAGRRQAALPRYLDPADVERVIKACDPSTPLGARDHAVILLLARLGLRGSDVSGLCLDDIDWAHARLRVSGKSRRPTWLPLPQEAGDALLHYIETSRPAVGGEGVFLITRAPYTPIIQRQVSSTAERAIRRAGIKAPSYGAHLFRHSAATAWLRQGMTLQAIGSVLRHRDPDTTALYAKVDVDLLRRIAMPWPQEEKPC